MLKILKNILGFMFHSFFLISPFLSDYLTRGSAEPHSFPGISEGLPEVREKVGKDA